MNEPTLFEFASFEQVKDRFLKTLRAGAGQKCPCCGRYAQQYRRRLHSSTAAQLIRLYTMGGHAGFVHASQLILDKSCGVGDFSKAKYWDLIEAMTTEPTGGTPQKSESTKKSSGWWRLTDSGREFVLGEIDISEWADVYDDEVLAHSDRMIGIHQALAGKFDYSDLMMERAHG